MSTLNAVPFRSTILYNALGAVPAGSVLTVGSNGTQSYTTNLGLNAVTFSTLTGSTLGTTNAVGIATTSPVAILDVLGSFRVLNQTYTAIASGTGVDIIYSGGGQLTSGTRSAGVLTAATMTYAASSHTWYVGSSAGTNAMTINSSGQVGIGTASVRRTLDVVGAPTFPFTYAPTQLSLSDTAGSSLMNLLIGVSGTSNYASIQASLSGTGPVPLLLNGSGGNVGIGMTNPRDVLHTMSATTSVIRIGASTARSSVSQLVFDQAISDYWHGNGYGNNPTTGARGAAYGAAMIQSGNESGNNYENSYMTFHTCRDPQSDGTGGLGVLYERMRINSLGYVGIGTNGPSSLLHVNGAINCTSFLVNGTAVATGTGSVWGVSGSVAYYTSGNVGIGTTVTQNNMLRVFGGNTTSGISLGDYFTTAGVKYIGLTAVSDGTNVSTSSGFSGITWGAPFDGGGTSGYLAFHTHGYGITSGERMRIDKTGNVGIGTATPGQPLHVYSGSAGILTLEQSSTNPNYISFRSNGSTNAYIGLENSTGGGLFGSTAGYGLSMGTNTNGGGLVAFAVSNVLRMNVGTAATAPFVDNTYACGYGSNRWTYVYAVNGTIQTSDPSRKVITPLPYGLTELLQVNPIKYKWKDEFVTKLSQEDIENDVLGAYQDMSSFEYYGVNAEEVHEIFPELVYHENSEHDKGINYGELVPVCINAIKELHATNQAQTTQIVDLQNQVATLTTAYTSLLERLTAAGIA